jgi:hypothetical protein
MVFAGLGAAEVLEADARHLGARELLRDAAAAIGPRVLDESWPWPEPRLSYANATLAEVLIVAGALLGRPEVTDDGLAMLRWLLDRETVGGHLSPTPVGGSGPDDDPGVRFDQQPIEVAAMADACARAAAVTADPVWLAGVERAVRWFSGDNDAGVAMTDPVTGGGYDGLCSDGPNRNQGAESTLAMIATDQLGRRLAAAAP